MSKVIVITATHRQILKMLPLPRHKIVKALSRDGLTKTQAESIITSMVFDGLLSSNLKNHTLIPGPNARGPEAK